MGYTYVSVMYRLCIGYVSVKRRNIKGAMGGFNWIFFNTKIRGATLATKISKNHD